MEEKKRKTNPLRLARRKYAIKVEATIDEPTALAVEAGMREDRQERGVEWESALAALTHRIQYAADQEVEALRAAGTEMHGAEERQKAEEKIRKLRLKLEEEERKLGLHQDPVVSVPDEHNQPDPPPPPPPGDEEPF